MRAIKRIRYGVKELDRLKTMLVNAGEIEVKEGGEIEHICLGERYTTPGKPFRPRPTCVRTVTRLKPRLKRLFGRVIRRTSVFGTLQKTT